MSITDAIAPTDGTVDIERTITLNPRQAYDVADIVAHQTALAIEDAGGATWDTLPQATREQFAAIRAALEEGERILDQLDFGTPWHAVTLRLSETRLKTIADDLLELAEGYDDVRSRGVKSDARFAILDQLEATR